MKNKLKNLCAGVNADLRLGKDLSRSIVISAGGAIVCSMINRRRPQRLVEHLLAASKAEGVALATVLIAAITKAVFIDNELK